MLWTQANKKGFTCSNDERKICIRWRCGESNPKKVEVYFPSGTVEGEISSSHPPAPPIHEDGIIQQPTGIYIIED